MTGKVAFGYLHPGDVSAVFMDSVVDMLFFDAQCNGRFLHRHGKMGKRAGSAGIVDGRNHLTKVMLDESEADWLLMIDADMGFAPETCERLVESAHAIDRPVVGGLCFAYRQDPGRREFGGASWSPVPTLYDWVETDDEVGFLPRMDYLERGERVQQVSATGAACILIHRRVLDKIRGRYGDDEWWEPIKHPSGRKFSEDMSFCIRVASVDEPLHVDTAVRTTHHKGAIYFDEERFVSVRQGV